MEAPSAPESGVPAHVTAATSLAGFPVDPGVRELFEPGLQHDLGRIRIFAHDAADRSTRALGARAYAWGPCLVFGHRQYAPHHPEGIRLLAHEISHALEPPDGRVRRAIRVEAAEADLATLRGAVERLVGRRILITDGLLSLGEPAGGRPASVTAARLAGRLLEVTPQFVLRASARTVDGRDVRGVDVDAERRITINTADAGAFTWTIEELLIDGFSEAVRRFAPLAPEAFRIPAGPFSPTDLLTLPIEQILASAAGRAQALQYLREISGLQNTDALERAFANAEATGVTLAAIARGIEQNAPFRSHQEVSGDRIDAIYLDPRQPAERRPGEPQPVGFGTDRFSMRSVTFLAGGSRGRPTPAPGATGPGCSEVQFARLNELIAMGQRATDRAIERLGSTEDLSAPLRSHFGEQGSEANRELIAANLRLVRSELEVSRHVWTCRTARASETTPGSHHVALALGNPGDPQLLPPWDTVLHEVVHASGVGRAAGGPRPRGQEHYYELRGEPGSEYPGPDPLHNADSYAEIVQQLGGATAMGSPAATPAAPGTLPSFRIFGGAGGSTSGFLGYLGFEAATPNSLEPGRWGFRLGGSAAWSPRVALNPAAGGGPAATDWSRFTLLVEPGIQSGRIGPVRSVEVGLGAGLSLSGQHGPDILITPRLGVNFSILPDATLGIEARPFVGIPTGGGGPEIGALGGLTLTFGSGRERPRPERSGSSGSVPRPAETTETAPRDFASITPWRLARLSDAEIAALPMDASQRIAATRAHHYAQIIFQRFPSPFDPDTAGLLGTDASAPPAPGSAPDPVRDSVRRLATQILDRYQAEPQVGPGSETLRARAASRPEGQINLRVGSENDLRIKTHQLMMMLLGPESIDPAMVVRDLIANNLTATAETVTIAERRTLAYGLTMLTDYPGLYYPPDHAVYVSDAIARGVASGDVGSQATLAHELGHAVAGGERTRQVFVSTFGHDWPCFWSPFEEGMAELVSATGASLPGNWDPDVYREERRLIADLAGRFTRERLIREYVSGTPSTELLADLRTRVPPRHFAIAGLSRCGALRQRALNPASVTP